MSSSFRDLGAFHIGRGAMPNLAVTAAGSGDASEVTGGSIDRLGLGSVYQSATLYVTSTGTLQSGETMTIAANFQDSADDSTFADHGTVLAATTVHNAAGGALTASVGQAKLDVDLSAARRYVLVQVTADMSATGTDTANIQGVIVFGGAEELPAA